jgi:hypothetical protein
MPINDVARTAISYQSFFSMFHSCLKHLEIENMEILSKVVDEGWK